VEGRRQAMIAEIGAFVAALALALSLAQGGLGLAYANSEARARRCCRARASRCALLRNCVRAAHHVVLAV
jgi:hypothetical protein